MLKQNDLKEANIIELKRVIVITSISEDTIHFR